MSKAKIHSKPDSVKYTTLLRAEPKLKQLEDKLPITVTMLQRFNFLAELRLEFINKEICGIKPKQQTPILMEEIFMYVDTYKPFIRKMLRPLNDELYTIYKDKKIEYEVLPPEKLKNKYGPTLERLIFGESFSIPFSELVTK
jgi:hypothetical protein